MVRRYFISTLLMLCISLGTAYSISGQSEYTTTVTEYFTTVLSTLKTEILENKTVFTTTQTITSLIEVEIHKTVLQPTIVMSPTQVIVEETYTDTISKTKADGSVVPVPVEKVRRVTVNQYATLWVNMPTLITSTQTTTATIVQTVEYTNVSKITQSRTEVTTMTLENVYTSTGTSFASTNHEWVVIPDFFYDYFLWILLLIALIAAGVIAFTLRHPRIRSGKAVSQSFCINCGSPIPFGVKHCPKCGVAQK